MPNNYLPGLMQIRPQYVNMGADTPENVLYMAGSEPDGYTLTQLEHIQGVFDTGWSNMWKIMAAEDVTYLGSVITDWTSASGLENSTVGTFTPVAGLSSGIPSAQVAVLISWTVGLRWRGGHFRTYLPGLAPENLQDESHITADTQGNINTQLATLQTALLDISGTFGGPVAIVAFRFKNAKPTDANRPTTYPYVTSGAQTLLATQRRRLRKVTRK
jgi:hypothetical protein